MVVVKNNDDLLALLNREFGVSEWHEVTQDQINAFAEVTGDFQWIHIDTEKCKTDSPFGAPIAHGYLILSLLPKFFYEIIAFENSSLTINYGLDKVRFIHPVPVGSYLRARFKLIDLKEIESGVRLFTQATFDLKEVGKPACIAQSILQVMWK